MNLSKYILWTISIALTTAVTQTFAGEPLVAPGAVGFAATRPPPVQPWPQPPQPTDANPLVAPGAAGFAATRPPPVQPWPQPPQPTDANPLVAPGAAGFAATRPPPVQPWPQPPQPTDANPLVAPGAAGFAATRPPPVQPWPQPPQPTDANPLVAPGAIDFAATRPPPVSAITSLTLLPCCRGEPTIGGGFVTRASGYDLAGQHHERFDVLFAVRMPMAIIGLDNLVDFADTTILLRFARGNQQYAECALEPSLNRDYIEFALAIESVDDQTQEIQGSCDLNLDEDGFQPGVPQIDMHDSIDVYALGEFGKVQFGRSGLTGYLLE